MPELVVMPFIDKFLVVNYDKKKTRTDYLFGFFSEDSYP